MIEGQRCAVVTGAAQGLGRAIVLQLLQQGMAVVAADSQGAKLATLGQELGHPAFHPVAGDLSREEGAAALIEAAVDRFGRLDILINSAGGSGNEAVREIEDLRVDLWHSVFANNVHATFLCCREVVPVMRRAGFGRIVNFSSSLAAGSTAWPTTVGARLAYCATKGAIEALSRQLALDLAAAGITVNVIVPGFILTEPGARVHERFLMLSPDDRQRLIGDTAVDELPSSRDVAESVGFLVSEQAGHITGNFVRVG